MGGASRYVQKDPSRFNGGDQTRLGPLRHGGRHYVVPLFDGDGRLFFKNVRTSVSLVVAGVAGVPMDAFY